ncbi:MULTISPECIES: helix-turn-helix transcriptional regulator [Hafnia]|jgi:predicted DNA-binding transcriptional regulator AlpA|uniref:helix-turn-helix transcriptional regulator n=1 Tax=Hafnia TaxID=568 RepID=UPI0010332E46|nr:excisionase [Hafnia alvei]TBL95274.1 excisionase [Hafnia alvei]
MTHNMSPDSLVDLKFIKADTGFGKTFIYDRVKDGTLAKPEKIHGRSRWRYSDLCEFKSRLLSRSSG